MQPDDNRKKEDLRLANVIIDKSPVILFRRLADDPKLVYISRNIDRFGYSAEEFMSDKVDFRKIGHPDDLEQIRNEIIEYAENDVEEYSQTYRIITKSGEVRWVEDQTSVVRDANGVKTHIQGVLTDISERKLAEDELKRSEEKFRRIVETAGEGFLFMDKDLTVIDVNDTFCKMMGYNRDEVLGKKPIDLATETFRQFMSANRTSLMEKEYRTVEGSMLAKDGRVVPVLMHANTLTDIKGEILGEVAFVTDLTEQKKALALAGNVQKSLIPNIPPDIDGLDIAGRSISCDEVGGDYFDFLFGPEYSKDSLKVVVGDISGHGVDAALLMTTARAFIRTRATQSSSVSTVISASNKDLSQDLGDTGNFMTLFFMEIDPVTGTVQWVRAGHEPALIYDSNLDRFDELLGEGLPLGVDEEFEYPEYKIEKLTGGKIIVLGTDGVWECTDAHGEIFGKERFREIIVEYANENAENIINKVFDGLAGFTKGVPPQDDITLVIIKVD